MFDTTQAKFLDDVLKLSYAAPVVVLFHAEWCGPCKTLKPIVERLSASLAFPLVGVDAGAERGLVSSEGVRGVPTLIVYKDGTMHGKPSVGGKTEAQIRDFLYKASVTQNTLEFDSDDHCQQQ